MYGVTFVASRLKCSDKGFRGTVLYERAVFLWYSIYNKREYEFLIREGNTIFSIVQMCQLCGRQIIHTLENHFKIEHIDSFHHLSVLGNYVLCGIKEKQSSNLLLLMYFLFLWLVVDIWGYLCWCWYVSISWYHSHIGNTSTRLDKKIILCPTYLTPPSLPVEQPFEKKRSLS